MFLEKIKSLASPLGAKTTKEKAIVQPKKEASEDDSSDENEEEDDDQSNEKKDDGEEEPNQTKTKKPIELKKGNKSGAKKSPVVAKPIIKKKIPKPNTK